MKFSIELKPSSSGPALHAALEVLRFFVRAQVKEKFQYFFDVVRPHIDDVMCCVQALVVAHSMLFSSVSGWPHGFGIRALVVCLGWASMHQPRRSRRRRTTPRSPRPSC